jgi:transcriptional regulator with XRE-family HTH domain
MQVPEHASHSDPKTIMNNEGDDGKNPSAIEKKIARMLVRLRRDNELTLSELSERTGLSESYLSRVENLKAPISISKLTKLAKAFVVPVTVFFEGESSSPRCRFTPAGEGTNVRLRGRNGINVRLLADTLRARMMEPFIVDVSTAVRGAAMQAHEGDEFIYVLKGRCRLYFGEETYNLDSGDSIYFDSSIVHRIEPVDHRPCEVLSVVTSRDFTFHGDLARLINE